MTTDGIHESPQRVAVVITTYNHAHYLPDAIASVAQQTRPADEVIVVDDGSSDDPAAVVRAWPNVRLIRQDNQGLSAARNTGLRAMQSHYVLFLDADDMLTPVTIEAGLECFGQNPAAAFVFGAHLRVDVHGVPLGSARYEPIGPDPYLSLLRGNVVAMHATALYHSERLLRSGGFDENLVRCEDYDLYLRLARRDEIACHPTVVARYRWHGANMSANHRAMLGTVLAVLRAHRPTFRDGGEVRRSWRAGRRAWREYYAQAELDDARRSGRLRLRDLMAAARISPALVTRGVARSAVKKVRHRTR